MADRVTNHNNRVLQHSTIHVLLANNHAAFLARIMEDQTLVLTGPQGRGLQMTGFEMFSGATLSCDPSRDYGLTSNKFPQVSGAAAHCRGISLARVGEDSLSPSLRDAVSFGDAITFHHYVLLRHSGLRLNITPIMYNTSIMYISLCSLWTGRRVAGHQIFLHPLAPLRRVVHLAYGLTESYGLAYNNQCKRPKAQPMYKGAGHDLYEIAAGGLFQPTSHRHHHLITSQFPCPLRIVWLWTVVLAAPGPGVGSARNRKHRAVVLLRTHPKVLPPRACRPTLGLSPTDV